MAQGNQGWHGHTYPTGPNGLQVSEGDLNNFNNFQQQPYENQPYTEPKPSQYIGQPAFPDYSLPSGAHFTGDGYVGNNIPNHTPYFSNTNHFGNDSNGSGLHGHGAPNLQQQYSEPSFTSHTGFENSLGDRFIAEQPSQRHSHTPNAFSAQSWQDQSVQQPSAQYNQGVVGYDHNPQSGYQQRSQVADYANLQNLNPGQQNLHNLPPRQQNTFFSSPGFDPRNGQGHYSPQSLQHVVHFQNQDHGNAATNSAANSTAMSFQPMVGITSQAFAGTQGPVQLQHNPQIQGSESLIVAPVPRRSSQPTQIAGPQVPQGQKQQPLPWASQDWQILDGCPLILVKNPPKTKLGRFSDIRLANTDRSEVYVAEHDTHVKSLFPDRRTRLPCEIQKEINDFEYLLQSASSQSERTKIENNIQQLYNEEVLIADNEDSTPPPPVQEAKIKTTAKRKSLNNSANMTSTKKSRALESGSDEEEDFLVTLARQISINPRPADSLKAVEYEIVRILWRDPKYPEPSQEIVRENVRAFGEFVLDQVTKYKNLKDAMDKAEGEGDKTKSEELRTAMEKMLNEIHFAIEAAIKFGDRFTISQLGVHSKLIVCLFNLLRSRFTENDYNGRLSQAILKLLSLVVTIDSEFLMRVKLDKLRQKFKDNLEEDTVSYIDIILDNGKKRSAFNEQEARENAANSGNDTKKSTPSLFKKKAPAAGTRDNSPMAKASPSKSQPQPKKVGMGAKKMQPTDYSGLGSARKISNMTAKTVTSQVSSKRPRDDDADQRAPKKAAVEGESGAPSNAKAPSVTAPTSTSASSVAITQARSRPGGSMLPGRSRMAPKVQLKKPAPPPPASTSSIGNLLAQITNPKEETKKRAEPEKILETPEETERRLRKQARRHLRVSWKPDDELTDVRIFEHDTAEDKGRDQNMLRDARDSRSEGRMFKQGMPKEDEDEDAEVALRSCPELSLVASASDKGGIPEKQMKNFVTHSGQRPVESVQKKMMEEYESRELLAIYTSASEIPYTPGSPTGRFAEVVRQPKIRVPPSDPTKWHESLPATNDKHREIHSRWKDGSYFGPDIALDNALRRLTSPNAYNAPKAASVSNMYRTSDLPGIPNMTSTNSSSMTKTHYQPGMPLSTPSMPNVSHPRTQQESDNEVLSLLKSDKVKHYVDPDPYDPSRPKTKRRHDYPDAKVQRDIDAIEDVFASFMNLSGPTSHPPKEPPQALQSNEEPERKWADAFTNQGAPLFQQGINQWENAHRSQGLVPPQPQPEAQPSQQQQPPINKILEQIRALTANTQPVAQPAAFPIAQQLQSNFAALNAHGPGPVPGNGIHNGSEALDQRGAGLSNYSLGGASNSNHQAWPHSQHTGYKRQNYSYNTQELDYDEPDFEPQGTQSQHDNNERGHRKDPHRGNKDHKGINRALIGTKPCTFWAKGQCTKGEKCTFRHDPNDLK
ncbi:hypothetical protein F4804DRAFT_146283 [Jackrogersella minutella]|nr:hypothetical protein F4804DRAFT_146283 [Jackrogersella minutella]